MEMDTINIQGNTGSAPPKSSRQPTRSGRKAKNDAKWDTHKEEIRRIYFEEKNTLPETMQRIEETQGFKAR